MRHRDWNPWKSFGPVSLTRDKVISYPDLKFGAPTTFSGCSSMVECFVRGEEVGSSTLPILTMKKMNLEFKILKDQLLMVLEGTQISSPRNLLLFRSHLYIPLATQLLAEFEDTNTTV